MSETPRYARALDLERCTGCHACSVACKVENRVPLDHFRTKVDYYDEGTFPRVRRHFLPVVCMQCADAPCLKACPTHSISRGEGGIVRIDARTCTGTGACEDACPYGAISVHPDRHVADKCDLGSHRLAAGMEPACVETCPGEVLAFGDLNGPSSRISRSRAARGAELTVLKPEEGTKPQVEVQGGHGPPSVPSWPRSGGPCPPYEDPPRTPFQLSGSTAPAWLTWNGDSVCLAATSASRVASSLTRVTSGRSESCLRWSNGQCRSRARSPARAGAPSPTLEVLLEPGRRTVDGDGAFADLAALTGIGPD